MKVKSNYRLLVKLSPLAAILVALVCWQLAFKRTSEVFQLYRASESEVASSAVLSISPGYTARRADAMQQQYEGFQVEEVAWKGKLWNACANLAQKHGLQVKNFPGVESDSLSGRAVFRQRLELSGSYFKLVSLQRELDTIARIGRITAVYYRKSPRENQTTLELVLTALPGHKSIKDQAYDTKN